MKTFELEREIVLPWPREKVFGFFADAANLERITPPWLRFRVTSPQPIDLREGARIEYRLRLRGLPLRWVSEISSWEPPHRFVDTQLVGPYRLWVHTHTFEEQGESTLARDHVRYAILCGRLLAPLLVQPDLERIFDYREARLREILAAELGDSQT